MKSKIQQYIDGCITMFEDKIREDEREVLKDELDKLWMSMTDEERDLADKEISDIVNVYIRGQTDENH